MPKLPNMKTRCSAGSAYIDLEVRSTDRGFKVRTTPRAKTRVQQWPNWDSMVSTCIPWMYRGGIWDWSRTASPGNMSMWQQADCHARYGLLIFHTGIRWDYESWRHLDSQRRHFSTRCGNQRSDVSHPNFW